MIYCEKQKKLVEEEGFCLLCDCRPTDKIAKESLAFQNSIIKQQDSAVQQRVNEQIALAIEEIANSLVGRVGDLLRAKAYEWRHKC